MYSLQKGGVDGRDQEGWEGIVSRGHTLIHRKRVWWTDDGQFVSALIGETAIMNCLVTNKPLAD